MKILIVSVFFPPHNKIAAYRAYSWAKWWSRQGHQVTVITPPKKQRVQNTPMSFDGFNVVELPAPGLELVRRFSANSSEVAFSQPEKSRNLIKIAFSGIRRYVNRLRENYGVFNASRMPDYWDVWAWIATRWAIKQDWDAVVTTGGPYSVHWVGLALKKKQLTRCWAMDWRDLWTGNHIFLGLPVVRLIERGLESWFHDTADIITTVSDPLANSLRRITQTPVYTIINGFDPEDNTTLDSSPIFPLDGIRRIVYTGSIYAGKRDPSPLFWAVKQLHDVGILSPGQLRIVFAGANCDPSELAQSVGIEDYCEYAGFVGRQQALRMQRDADLLLFLEFEAPDLDGILTGKLFEYLVAGPEILAVGIGNKTGAGKIIEDYGKGRALGKDVDKIRNTLREFIDSKVNKTSDQIYAKPLDIFTRETQALNYLSLLKTSINLVDG